MLTYSDTVSVCNGLPVRVSLRRNKYSANMMRLHSSSTRCGAALSCRLTVAAQRRKSATACGAGDGRDG
eukprot:762167-Prymnesium_polylepis.1